MPLSPTRPLHLGISRLHSAGADLIGDLGIRLAQAVQVRLGREVQLVLVDAYQDLVRGLQAGTLDVAWLPPLLQSEAEKQGARLIAVPQRGGWLTFRCALLVRRDDARLKRAVDLLGTRAAWRNEQSASGYLFPRLELLSQGTARNPPFASERFYGSVMKGAEAVARGEADFSTIFISEAAARDPAQAEREVTNSLGPLAAALRVIHVTDLIPPDGFSVGGHVAPEEERSLAGALHTLHTVPAGAEVLQSLLQAERLVPVQAGLLNSLRSWTLLAQARAGTPAGRG